MKKIILILLIIPLFFSCGKDEEVDNPLKNYAWEYKKEDRRTTVAHILLLSYDFTGNYSVYYDGPFTTKLIESHNKGSYSYNHPKLVFTCDNGDEITFKVSDDKKYITDEENREYKQFSK